MATDKNDAPVVIDDIPFDIDPAAAMKRAGIPAGTPDEQRFGSVMNKFAMVARPRALYRVCYIEGRGEDRVAIGGAVFRSRALRRNLEGINRVFPYVVTCGAEADAFATDGGDILDEFRLDALRELLLKSAAAGLKTLLESRYGLAGSSSMSPGSGDVSLWPIEQQRDLFALLGDVEGLVGVRLTESCLMLPTKSLSGIRFPTAVDFESCRLCRREVCRDRKAPFDADLWESIHE